MYGYYYGEITDSELDHLKKAGIPIYNDIEPARPEFRKCAAQTVKGDFIYTPGIDHLGDSIADIKRRVDELRDVKRYIKTFDGYDSKRKPINPPIDQIIQIESTLKDRELRRVQLEVNLFKSRERKKIAWPPSRIAAIKSSLNKSNVELAASENCHVSTIERRLKQHRINLHRSAFLGPYAVNNPSLTRQAPSVTR